jgi:hypothetical protein
MPTFQEIAEKVKPEDMSKIFNIAARAKKEYQEHGVDLDMLSLEMDLIAVHGHCQKLDLDKLFNFNSFNFAHDISGIISHLNRETIELMDCFLPRCAR